MSACSRSSRESTQSQIAPVVEIPTPPSVQSFSALSKSETATSLSLKGTPSKPAHTLSYEITTHAAHGSSVLQTGGLVTYTSDPGYVGTDFFEYRATEVETGTSSQVARVKILTVSNNAADSFWVRSEDIVGAGHGNTITNWPEYISGTNASFKNADRTPRLDLNRASQPLVDFQSASGALATNDYLYYQNRYLFSEADGLTMIAVARYHNSVSSIMPILSFGAWSTLAYGLNWSSTGIGPVTPTSALYGGRDDRTLYTVDPLSPRGLSVVVSEVKFNIATPGTPNGLQRVRVNGSPWVTSLPMALSALTATQIAESPTPQNNAGGGPMILGSISNLEFQPDRRFSGQIGEVLVLARILSSEELETLERALLEKFGITN